MLVTNSKGTSVQVYSTYVEAFNAEVLTPIEAGLSAGEVADALFNLDAIADAVLEWHTDGRDGSESDKWFHKLIGGLKNA